MILLLKLICSKLLNLTKGENSEKLFEKAQNIIKFLQFKFSTKSNELKLLPDKCNNTKSSNSNFLNIFAMDSSAKTPLNKYNSWINLKFNVVCFNNFSFSNFNSFIIFS